MATNISTGTFTNPEGFTFFTRRTLPSRPKAHLVVVHGLGEHTERYAPFMDYFASHGYAVSSYDLRGHGQSDGARGDVLNFSQWVDDARAMLWEFKRDIADDVPTIMVGHSLGGLIALRFLADHDEVDGAVISAPPLGSMPVPGWKVWLGMRVAKVLPGLPVGADIKPADLSRDPAIVDAYRKDRMVLKRVTVRAGQEIITSAASAMPLAYRIKTPILMVHGREDRICSADMTERFFEDVPASIKNIRLYDGAFHEPFTDVIKERVFQDVEDWIGTTVALRGTELDVPRRTVDRYRDQVRHQS